MRYHQGLTSMLKLLCFIMVLVAGCINSFAQHIPTRIIERKTDNQLSIPSDYLLKIDSSNSIQHFDSSAILHLPSALQKKNVEIKNAAYWLVFKVHQKDAAPWFLEFIDPHINHIEVFQIDTALHVKDRVQGLDYPFAQKRFLYKNYIYTVDLAAGDSATFFIKIRSDSKTSFLFKLRSVENVIADVKSEYYFLGIFYGIILITIITNIIVFLFIRERIYLFYSLYLIGCSLLFLSEDILGFEYLWPGRPELNHYVNFYSPVLVLVAFYLYANKFLKLENHLSRQKNWIRFIITISVIYFLVMALLQIPADYRVYFLPFSVVYVGAIAVWRKGSRSARYFIIAHSFVLIGIVFLIFRKSGINLFYSPITFFSLNIGFIIEIAILSYALGERIREFKSIRIKAQEKLLSQLKSKQEAQRQYVEQLRENQVLKDKLNEELEREVNKRSREIIEQNLIISRQNDELVNANLKLNEQAQQIKFLNENLDLDNWALKTNIKNLTEARILYKAVDFREFSKHYPDQLSCLKFIAEKKWTEGFVCKKCEHTNFSSGRSPYSRRCSRCRYEESATAYTLLHKCKIPLEKAFYAIFLIFSSKGEITSVYLSKKIGVRQSTCWSFMNKINAIIERKKNPWQNGWDGILLEEELVIHPRKKIARSVNSV